MFGSLTRAFGKMNFINARKYFPKYIHSRIQLKDGFDEIKKYYPRIVKDLTEGPCATPELHTDITKLLDYNCLGGASFYMAKFIDAYEVFKKPENTSREDLELARLLAWCKIIVINCILVMDDIIDGGVQRYKKPCWYKKENVGLNAINHGFFLVYGLYSLLDKYFSHLHHYPDIIRCINEFCWNIYRGQICENLVYDNGVPQLHKFTIDRYLKICILKTGYSLYGFFNLPLVFANRHDPELRNYVKLWSMDGGILLQIQNDYLDSFGNPSVTGKVGTDIEEGKCTWLSVMAMQKSTAAQRKLMEAHYGRKDPKSTEIVFNLYQELDLPSEYSRVTEEYLSKMREHAAKADKTLNQNFFLHLLEEIMDFKENEI